MRVHRSIASLSILVLVCAAAPSATFAADQPRARNVLLLIGDDHGLDGGCFGNAAVATPSLDRLAASGTRFANAFGCVSSCSPSRSVMLTGLFNHTNGQYGLQHATNNQVTEPWVQSLPKLFNDAGFRTALIGKNHVAPKDVYAYQQEVPLRGRAAKRFGDAAAQFFDAKHERPFFLVIGFHDPHRAKQGFELPKEKAIAVDHVPAYLPADPAVRQDLGEYYAAVARLDAGIGLVLDALETSGKAKETLVVYVGDNGIPFPGAKTNLYDPGIHLPMIVRSPDAKGGVVSQAMTSFIDIVPTALEFAGVKPPKYALPGRSLLPILEQEKPQGWDTVFASHTFHEIWMYYPMRMIRTPQYKLIWNLASSLEYPIAGDIAGSASWKIAQKQPAQNGKTPQQYLHRPAFELFDLQNDPQELKNLADDPKFADTKADLLKRLRQMMKETKDPWLSHGSGGEE